MTRDVSRWSKPGTRLGVRIGEFRFRTASPIPKKVVLVSDQIIDLTRGERLKDRHEPVMGAVRGSERDLFEGRPNIVLVDISRTPRGCMAILEDDEMPLFRILEMKGGFKCLKN